jgi:deoxyribose-phosphate aldolase
MTEPTSIPEQPRFEDLSRLFEQTLLAPQLSETDVAAGCELAKRSGLAAVIVRPSDLDLVTNWLRGSSVVLGTIVDVPHGHSSTAAKLFAARDALRRGAKEIDTVMNTGKLISRQFQYLETELLQMADACHASGAILKISLETEHLSEELKIVACRVAKRVGADFLGASTLADLAILKSHSRNRLKLKATAEPDSLDQAVAYRDAGCERMTSTQPASILEAWKAKIAERQLATSTSPAEPRP